MNDNQPFDDISAHIKGYEAQGNTHCEPVYLLPNRRGVTHSELSESATLTYVKYNGKHYAVSCAHVAEAQEPGKKKGRLLLPTVWGKNVRAFAFRAGSGYPVAGEFKFPDKPRAQHSGLDIAIAKLSPEFVRSHLPDKEKVPLDLDHWERPDWTQLRTCAALGYPNRAKSRSGDVIGAKLLFTILELQSTAMDDREEFTLVSTIPESAGTSLSGISGCAVYCLLKDGRMAPIGIVYEGTPGDSSQPKAEGSFYRPQDFQVHAYALNPTVFARWLRLAGFAP